MWRSGSMPDLIDAALHNYPTEGDVGGTPYTHPEYDPNCILHP